MLPFYSGARVQKEGSMNTQDILAVAGLVAAGLLAAAKIFQVKKIEINPWKTIVQAIARALTAELSEKMEAAQKSQDEKWSEVKQLFIDASSECVKVTNNNKLTPENINKIVDTFAQRAEEAHFSHLAEYSEVQENDYNLSVSTYVEAKDTREKIDIVKLNAEIAQIVARENELRAAIDQIVAEIEG